MNKLKVRWFVVTLAVCFMGGGGTVAASSGFGDGADFEETDAPEFVDRNERTADEDSVSVGLRRWADDLDFGRQDIEGEGLVFDPLQPTVLATMMHDGTEGEGWIQRQSDEEVEAAWDAIFSWEGLTLNVLMIFIFWLT